MDEMYYEEDFRNMYIDPYWSGNLLNDLSSDTYNSLVDKKILGGYAIWAH